jgi:hypothetical protein
VTVSADEEERSSPPSPPPAARPVAAAGGGDAPDAGCPGVASAPAPERAGPRLKLLKKRLLLSEEDHGESAASAHPETGGP